MSAALDFLVELHQAGIYLRAVPDGGLEYEGPEDLVTNEIVVSLREHKAELRKLLVWDEEEAYTLIRQALAYLAKRYVENSDLSALEPWGEQVNEAYARGDMGLLRVAIRGYVQAGLGSFRKSLA